ncbi:uncharacterized protein LOC143301409 isoform X6 [Babylonia areolata]|uniref:uncharacterized protein LOC143301409 isoform X6 n=1 Tax=Babylonia areolata TaxID=304850 RepID=UPI003FD37C8A
MTSDRERRVKKALAMSSQFDALLDFGEDPPPSTNGTAQQPNGGDDFDPFGPGPLDSGKGGGDGLLLDFSVSTETSSNSATKNGTALSDPFDASFSLNANDNIAPDNSNDAITTTTTSSSGNNPFGDMSTTQDAPPSANPLYDLMDDDFQQTDTSSSAAAAAEVDAPPSGNPLYDLSMDTNSDMTFDTNTTATTTVGEEESSANPLYDLMDADQEPGLEAASSSSSCPPSQPAASSDLLGMDMEQADEDEQQQMVEPDVAAAPTKQEEEEEEEEEGAAAESFDQNVELFIREEGEDQEVVPAGPAGTSADLLEPEVVDVGAPEPQREVEEEQEQEQEQQERVEEVVEEEKEEEEEEKVVVVEEKEEEEEEKVVVVEEKEEEEEEKVVVEEKARSRSRTPSQHSISSEGEVINEVTPTTSTSTTTTTFLSSTSISFSPSAPPATAVPLSEPCPSPTSTPSLSSKARVSISESCGDVAQSSHSDGRGRSDGGSERSGSTATTAVRSSLPRPTHVGHSMALLRLSRGQPQPHAPVSTAVKVLRHEEEMRQDQRAELQQQEEEEKKEEKRKSYQETTREEQTVDAAVGGAGQREDHAAADRDVVKEAQEPVPQQRQQTPPTQATTTTTTSSEQQWEDEAEEGVYENEPEQRSDVVRESDRNVGAELPSVGTAKSMRDKFVSGQVENAQMESKREATPPAAQVDGGVFENEPQYNPDVVHADDQGQEALPEEGTARNIAARFKEMEKQGSVPVPSPGKREITPDRTGKVEYVSEPRGHVDKYEPEVQAGIFESQPAERDDVVKSDELPEEVLPEKGSAKNIAERFKQLSTDNASSTPRGKREITPDTSGRVEYVSEPTGFVEKYEGHTESGVFESQPADREDVVKADTLPEDIMPEQGMARNIAARFKEMEKTTKSPPSPGKVKEFTPPRENGTGPQSSGVYESTPQVASDVVHADDQPEEVLPEKGMAKSIADRFRQLSSGDNTPTKSPRSKKEFTPPPGGSGVYENTPKQFVPDYNQPPESGILESKPETRSDVVRSDEPVTSEQELPERGYTKNLLSAWRQKESESSKVSPPSSGKPKEFTPPREEPRVTQQRPAPRTPKSPQAGTDMNDGSVHPSDLPGQYQPQAEASVFESEPERREDVVREEDTDWTQGMPKPDTTKKMLAKFKHIQQQAGAATDTPPAKPKPAARKEGEGRNSKESSPDKVGRSKSMRVPVQLEKCGACQKTVYAMEKIEIEKHSYHKSCFRCSHCHCILTPKTFAINNNIMFCTNHYKQLFATKGNYDEGFGRDQHKKRWKSEPNLADDEHSSPASAHH